MGQTWGGVEWSPWFNFLYSYDGTGKRVEEVTQNWGAGAWENSTREVHTCIAVDKPVESISQNWYDGAWLNGLRELTTYNAGLDPEEMITQEWDPDSWHNSARTLYTYGGTTAVGESGGLEDDFRLAGNFPNPFNPTTEIEFSIGHSSGVTLTIVDLLGRTVEVLVDDVLPPGSHRVTWDAAGATAGVYFYRLQSEKFTETRKLVLVK
jgi:hypothetical protein